MTLSSIDYSIFQKVNHLAAADPSFNPLMRFFSLDAEYLFILGVIAYWFVRRLRNRKMVLEALLSACISFAASALLAHWHYRNRPFVAHKVLLLIQHPANASFPSDHAIGAFVIATSIWLFRRKDGWVWLLLAAGISFSRVWTGVHYPADVVAGAAIGICSAWGVHKALSVWPLPERLLTSSIQLYETAERKLLKRKQESL